MRRLVDNSQPSNSNTARPRPARKVKDQHGGILAACAALAHRLEIPPSLILRRHAQHLARTKRVGNLAFKSIAQNLAALPPGRYRQRGQHQLVNLGPMLIPLPEGADVEHRRPCRQHGAVYPGQFSVPFSRPCTGYPGRGVYRGALAASHPLALAMLIGVFFLLGGIAAVTMLGGPLVQGRGPAAGLSADGLVGRGAGCTRPEPSTV